MERPEKDHIDQDANLDALANFVDYLRHQQGPGRQVPI